MTDDERDLEFVRRHVAAAIPAWTEDQLKRDLWPDMLRRMQYVPARPGWFEVALLGIIASVIFLVPDVLPVVLFHL